MFVPFIILRLQRGGSFTKVPDINFIDVPKEERHRSRLCDALFCGISRIAVAIDASGTVSINGDVESTNKKPARWFWKATGKELLRQ